MRKIVFGILLLSSIYTRCNAQEAQEKKYKIGLGTSLFNLNESFTNVFFLNNSSPIYVGVKFKEKYRIESIINLTLTESDDFGLLSSRGSIALSFDWLKPLYEKTSIYYGPKIGFNSNETQLVNIHVGGEYNFYKNWSLSTEIGLNYIKEFTQYVQTTSSIILRFYF